MGQQNVYTPRHTAPSGQSGSVQSQQTTNDPNLQKQIRRYQAQKRWKRVRRRRLMRSALVLGLIVLFGIAVVMIAKGLRRDELKGVWALDQTTVYEFDGNGKGTLRLPLNDYVFTYALDKNIVSIDFTDEHATDAIYSYSVDDSTLILDNNTGSVFHLEKQK